VRNELLLMQQLRGPRASYVLHEALQLKRERKRSACALHFRVRRQPSRWKKSALPPQ
jgi:hypothetical protein